MSRFRDLTGQQFGKLTVIRRAPHNRWKQSMWVCRCACGSEHAVNQQALVHGAVKSCQCSWHQSGPAHHHWNGVGEMPGRYWTTVVTGAQKRKLPVEITANDAWLLFLRQQRRCALSGVPLQFYKSARQYAPQTASLDRIDSSLGYTPANVQWIHKDLQRMKSNFHDSVFVEWCHRIATHRALPVSLEA